MTEKAKDNLDTMNALPPVQAKGAHAPADKKPDAPAVDTTQKTTGEKYYHRIKFAVAEAFILYATGVIAYVSRYGKSTYKGTPNVLKKFQDKFEHFLLENKVYPLGHNGPTSKRLAEAASSAMVTMHGGNLFAPIMMWFENRKRGIVDYFNKSYGKPGELEAGHERLKDEPKQTWADIIKGRATAFVIVFSSFFGIDVLLGKSKSTPDTYRFDKFGDWFGRKVAGLTKEGKAIAKIPLSQKIPEELAKNKSYRFGKILALDIYATTAAIMIWNAISHLSAKHRHADQSPGNHHPAGHSGMQDALSADSPDTNPESNFTDRISPIAAKNNVERLAAQRQAEASAPSQVLNG